MRPASLIIVILLSFAPKMLQGQYIPMVEEGKYWIYQNYYISGDNFLAVSGHALTFEGDTIINSINYKKIYQHMLKGGHPCMYPPCWQFSYPYQTESKSLISFIREDTLSKKVYNFPFANAEFCDTIEHLIFDFSLSIGDAVNTCIYNFIGASFITEPPLGIVDSFGAQEIFGKNRNTIYTTGGLPFWQDIAIERLSIIEGVGLEGAGIFFNPLSRLHDYCEGEMAPCQLISSNSDIEKTKPIHIFPNPANDILQISTEDAELISIRIYSIMGLLKTEFFNTNTIELSNLHGGIYLLEIFLADGERVIKKIIKEN